jgi:hypothetical protein
MGVPTGAGRSLHVIDLENLASGLATESSFLDALGRYRRVALVGARDSVEIALDVNAWRRVAFSLPRSWRVRVGFGPDGADRALLDAVDFRVAVERFDRVVIGSGDGAFAPLVAGLVAAGRRVEVVSNRHALSRRLARAATAVFSMPEPPRTPPEPAALAA